MDTNKLFEAFLAYLQIVFSHHNNKTEWAMLHDMLSRSEIKDLFYEAFSTAMWKGEEECQEHFTKELEMMTNMIPKITDPDDKNTLAIWDMFKKFIAERKDTDVEELTDKEIDTELIDENNS